MLFLALANAVSAFELIAHRGYADDAAENTLASVSRAWAAGADSIEVDVRVSADGVAYLFHDDRVGEVDLDGLAYEDVAALAGDRVPQLSVILQAVPRDGRVILDVKETRVDRIAVIVNAVGLSDVNGDNLWYQSEHPGVLATLRRHSPHASLAYVDRLEWQIPFVAYPRAPRVVARLQELAVDGVSVKGRTFISRAYVETIRDAGFRVNVWTINDPARARYYADIGVDGIITDKVPEVRRAIAGR